MDQEKGCRHQPLDAEAGTGPQGHGQGIREGDTARLSLQRWGAAAPTWPTPARSLQGSTPGAPHLRDDSYLLKEQPSAA